MKNPKRGIVFALVSLVVVLISSPARAETTQCTPITTIPITITVQGIYCFSGNLAGNMASGNAITIDTNNVTIDFNGFKLGNLAAGPSTFAKGIYADNKKNITLRNGTIRGFHYGIRLLGSTASGHLVEDMRLDGNTYLGIYLSGKGAMVRNNQVVSTGDTTTGSNLAYGIFISSGEGASIINNDVADTVEGSGGTSKAITCHTCSGTVIKKNRVSNSAAGPGIAYGIYVDLGSNNLMVDNRMANNIDYGIYLATTTGAKLSDNLTYGVTPP